MKRIITYTVNKDNKAIPQLEYDIDHDVIKQLSDTYLGKNLIVTDREQWDNDQIILAYRSQFHIENVFNPTTTATLDRVIFPAYAASKGAAHYYQDAEDVT